MSHQINDEIVDTINDEWTDMSVEDFSDWLETHKDNNINAYVVLKKLVYLEQKWKQEKFDSYRDS